MRSDKEGISGPFQQISSPGAVVTDEYDDERILPKTCYPFSRSEDGAVYERGWG